MLISANNGEFANLGITRDEIRPSFSALIRRTAMRGTFENTAFPLENGLIHRNKGMI